MSCPPPLVLRNFGAFSVCMLPPLPPSEAPPPAPPPPPLPSAPPLLRTFPVLHPTLSPPASAAPAAPSAPTTAETTLPPVTITGSPSAGGILSSLSSLSTPVKAALGVGGLGLAFLAWRAFR